MKRTAFLALLALCALAALLLGTATTFAQAPSPAVIESYLIQNLFVLPAPVFPLVFLGADDIRSRGLGPAHCPGLSGKTCLRF